MSHVSSFNTEITPKALAYVTKDALKIGLIERIQRLHVKKIPLGETPRRIAYQEETHLFGILTTKIVSPEEEQSFFKILDDQTFESKNVFAHADMIVLDEFSMEKYEVVQSLVSVPGNENQRPAFVVGTAFVVPTEEEPSKGRLLVFEVNDFKRIELLQQMDVSGCVYSISAFEGDKIVAGINAKVHLYQWSFAEGHLRILTSLCAHHGYIVALNLAVYGNFIVVGDLMKSVSVLTYNSEDMKLVESYRDYATNWMTAVEAFDQDHFIGADNHFNLFTLHKHMQGDIDDQQLVEDGQFHVGEMINRFRHGAFEKIYRRCSWI